MDLLLEIYNDIVQEFIRDTWQGANGNVSSDA